MAKSSPSISRAMVPPGNISLTGAMVFIVMMLIVVAIAWQITGRLTIWSDPPTAQTDQVMPAEAEFDYGDE